MDLLRHLLRCPIAADGVREANGWWVLRLNAGEFDRRYPAALEFDHPSTLLCHRKWRRTGIKEEYQKFFGGVGGRGDC